MCDGVGEECGVVDVPVEGVVAQGELGGGLQLLKYRDTGLCCRWTLEEGGGGEGGDKVSMNTSYGRHAIEMVYMCCGTYH